MYVIIFLRYILKPKPLYQIRDVLSMYEQTLKISELIEKSGLTLEELADKTGISKNELKHYIDNNFKRLSIDKAIGIAKALNTTVGGLLGQAPCNTKIYNPIITKEESAFILTYRSLSDKDKKDLYNLLKSTNNN